MMLGPDMKGENAMPHAIASTKSGLPIPVIVVEQRAGRVRAAREHPGLVRLAHWVNAVSLVVLTMSGLQIFAAFPSFGPKVPQSDIATVPEAIRLGGWLGGALQWHFTFAWLFAATGVIYVVYLAVSGHWRHVVLRTDEIGGVGPMVRHYLGRAGEPRLREPYNPLQKLAYSSTLLVGALAVATGVLLAKPVQYALVVEALGGFAAIRMYHFAAMLGLLAFVPGHLVMVALHGWENFTSMITGWKRRPSYFEDSEIMDAGLDTVARRTT
jgi:thiosulfate reductase cytochrome b subunit